MKWFEKIHHQALKCSRVYKKSEFQLLLAVQAVDGKKVYRKLGYASLFEYCVKSLKLTESFSYALINVSRKSIKMPKIKEAICEGKLTVSQAKRVMGVITPKTESLWLEKAATYTQRKLEREVVKHSPRKGVAETIRPISDCRAFFQCGIGADLEAKIRRVKEVLSQKNRRPCTLEDALEATFTEYLQKHDPIEKAKRAIARKSKSSTTTRVPARVAHQVRLNFNGQCAFTRLKQRCPNRTFLDIHHIKPKSKGGTHELSNLVLLCKGHHLAIHDSTLLKESDQFMRSQNSSCP